MSKRFLILLLLPLMAYTVADWFTVKLDERVTVSFPAEPLLKESGGNPMWVHETDSTSRYMAMIIDFEKLGMDSAMLANEMQKPETFEQFKNGVLSQMAGASLISGKQSLTEGRNIYEYVFDMGKKDSKEFNIMHNRNIFIGSKLYSLSFFEKPQKPQEALRDRFFSSFKTAW
jgi:hypothetical protein